MKKTIVFLLTGMMTFAFLPMSVMAAGPVSSNSSIESSIDNTDEVNSGNTITENSDVVNTDEVIPTVSYSAHVQNTGWQSEVKDGSVAGTTGRGLHMEALKINVSGVDDLGITYQAHVQNIGWQGDVSNGTACGTTGKSLGIEAVRIKLTGANASKYDIYYCTHVGTKGWMNWAKNGATSGSTGISCSIEAIEIKIVPAGSAAPEAPGTLYSKDAAINGTGSLDAAHDAVSYKVYQQDIGWEDSVSDGTVAGVTGKSKRLELINISDSDEALTLNYSVHVADTGWMDYATEGTDAGIQGKAIQAVKIKLSGADASKYDVYYCAHVQNYGWLNWTKNDGIAGTTGLSYQVEAIAVRITVKGSTAPAKLGSFNFSNIDSNTILAYQAHVENIGWQNEVSNGATAGTTGRSLRVEALKIRKAGTSIGGSVNYKVHVQNIGWMNPVSNGAVAGTTGRSLRVEAVSVSLSGDIASAFDVYYRTHVQNVGWTGWAVNGANCGSQGYGRRVEAIEIRLVAKGKPAPGSTSNTFSTYVAPKPAPSSTPAPVVIDATDSLAQSISSATNYLLLVDQKNHLVSAYKGSQNHWGRINRFSCDVGKPSTPTITGFYTVGNRGKYFNTGSNQRCWYWTQIKGNYLFHSVIYDRSSSPVHVVDGRMGQSVSHGCVRLDIDNAYWIYSTIPWNTKIYIWK